MTRPLPQVALTFDDGPSGWTAPILDVLAENGARASFFVIGEWIDGREELLRRMLAEGHDVGNHTFGHPRLPTLNNQAIRSELGRTTTTIEEATGRRPVLFRAPAFRKDERVLRVVAEAGLVDIGCQVDPQDWRHDVAADTIVEHVLAGVSPRAIVDLHDGFPPRGQTSRRNCGPTVDAVRAFVPELRERGFELVSLSELLSSAPVYV